MVVCNYIHRTLMSLKPKHPPLVVFFYYPNGDIGIVRAMGAIVEVVVGFGAIFQDTPQLTVGEYIDSKMQSHTYAVTGQIVKKHYFNHNF